MKLPITPEFEREEKAFSLRRHCEDCVLYDVERPTRDRCAHGYPTEEHLSFWKSPPRFPMGALPPNPAEGFVRVDLSTLSQFLEIASAISDGGFAPKPRRGIRSRRFIDALSAT
jgi:hypothetical protein